VRYSTADASSASLDAAVVGADTVISFVVQDGVRGVLSRFGDPVWDLSPYIQTANTARSQTLIHWSKLPAGFVPGVKAILFRYWMAGRTGGIRPTAATAITLFVVLRRFLHWVHSLGVQRLAEISPLHCMGWVQRCRDRNLAPRSQKAEYWAIEALYVFREHSEDALQAHPWPESSARRLAGIAALDHTTPSTKLIPPPIVERLFQGALDLIDRADAIFDARDRRRGAAWHHPDLILLRSACYIILGLTSGCRNHELASIEEGAVRQSTHDGEVYFWLKGVSLKTHCGSTEWMIPEIGARCVQILERWAQPLRVELRTQLASLRRRLAETSPDAPQHTTLLNQQRRLEANRHRLFLGMSNGGGVTCVSGGHWTWLMREFCHHVGVDWPLATHQLRRTFAANVANHILGDLIYLKHHYKHWSLDMTALYALNAQQEQELFDEVLHAVREKKVRIIEHWFDEDCMIIGGAAPPIKAFRAKHRLATVPTRRKLAEDTSELVNIRATGHGWCLASDAGCGGQGLYEPTRCLGCRNGVIDSSHIPVWQSILAQQQELLVSAADCGPSGARRIERDLAHAQTVLRDLGVKVEGDNRGN
jgi:hypothetical protein